jgi:hypothetical protein
MGATSASSWSALSGAATGALEAELSDASDDPCEELSPPCDPELSGGAEFDCDCGAF